jgi:hypothetical protein
MITDIEYLDFPFDKTYKRTPLCARSHERILNYSRSCIYIFNNRNDSR